MDSLATNSSASNIQHYVIFNLASEKIKIISILWAKANDSLYEFIENLEVLTVVTPRLRKF